MSTLVRDLDGWTTVTNVRPDMASMTYQAIVD